jgi:hypothetical protein
MRGPTANTRSEEGSALVAVTILSLVMMISALAVLEVWRTDTALALRDARASQAFFLAESGIERGRAWLKAQGSLASETQTIYPFGDSPDTLAGGSYLVSIVPDPLNPTAYPDIFTIACVATGGSRAQRIEADYAAECFADFLYFTDLEHTQGGGNPSWFITPDVINGPLHTNDQIHIMGDPTFRENVRSAWGGPDDENQTHNPMFEYYNGHWSNHIESAAASNPPHDFPTFEDGYELGSSAIELPQDAVPDFADLAQNGGIYLNGGYQVEIGREDAGGNPMYGYVSYRRAANMPWTDVEIASTNGVLYVRGQVEILGGILDGHLTISSNVAMTIEDDIVYGESDENGPLPDCDDMLGLVCMGDIIVSDNEANGEDCVIHGSIVATNTSFIVEHWANGDPRGTLTVHGGICQKFRGAVGTFMLVEDEAVVLTGYAKDYHYDERFVEMAPPGFELILMTGDYRRLAWRDAGSWSVCGN